MSPPIGVTGPCTVPGASVTERPSPERGTGSDKLAGRLAGSFAGVQPGMCVEAAWGLRLTLTVLLGSRKRLSKPEWVLELAAYMNISPQFFLKPEGADFSMGFGNVHPAPELGVE